MFLLLQGNNSHKISLATTKQSKTFYLCCSFISIVQNIPSNFQVTDLIEGEYQDILKLISKILNIRIRQFKRFDRGWGKLDTATGKWSGIISNLINGEADVGIGSFTICCRRTEAVDFLWTISQPREAFAIKG